VQEFQISTFNYDISTSTTSVGSVNVVSRSGSNDFHGSAFMYYRDHNLSGYPLLKRDSRTPDPFFSRKQNGRQHWRSSEEGQSFSSSSTAEYNNQHSVVLVSNNHPIWSSLMAPFRNRSPSRRRTSRSTTR